MSRLRLIFYIIFFYFYTNNIFMSYLIFILIGAINGLFSSGAGQLLIFYLVYILKRDTKLSREYSLTIMPIISIPTFIIYRTKSSIDITMSFIFIVISLVFGFLGNKMMKKVNPNLLNLISGIFLVLITGISLWRTL